MSVYSAVKYPYNYDIIKALVNLNLLPADVLAGLNSLGNYQQKGDGVDGADAAINAIKVGGVMLEAALLKAAGTITVTADFLALLNDSAKFIDECNGSDPTSKGLHVNTALSIAGDVAGIAAGLLLVCNPASLSVFVALSVISAGLAVYTSVPQTQDDLILTKQEMDCLKTILADTMQTIENSIENIAKEALSDVQLMADVIAWGLDKYVFNNDFMKDFIANQLEAGNSLLDKLVSEFDTLRKSGIKFATKFHFVTPGYCDPLMLDLDGDGIETKSIGTANVKFDMDKDGFAEKVGWIAPDDGFLALDRNGNGTIDDIGELFGKETVSGFDELKQQDVNADGRIDANDAVYANLKVWRDLNGNGVSDAGELQSLADAGVASINLNNQTAGTENNGNIISHTGSFTRADGTTGTVADVNLQISQTYSCYKGGFTFDTELLTLPWLRGFGEVAALPIAADGYDYEIRRMA